MAQTGYTPILTYASGTASNVPLAADLTTNASAITLQTSSVMVLERLV